MAESHEMLLDVKLDLKDVKNDNCLKNWVNWMKCHVKIDAIECFPCYLKVSFYHEDDANREYPFSIIRLNIPGVRVGSAASRTKSFAYGIFWKNNRKRCRLFLAFQDKQSCSTHMKWLKRSIDSLEFYRKDILENHRVSRSIVNISRNAADEDESPLDISKNSLNDTQTERDMNDILGPLPEIPAGDCCNRLSTRRSSGCSGIYEEIMDPADGSFKKEHESRGSVVSDIYVDMSAPSKLNTNSAEMPPPLPPRRRFLNHVYTTIDMQAVETSSGKSRKSTWNLKNVFGRTKGVVDAASKATKPSDVVKSQTSAAISNLCTTDACQSNLLTKCKNSFSTPDLTNMIACSPVPIATAAAAATAATSSNVKNELDETDLDVMDIERSNSLNCSTNQFACRPPPLNISDNILWSHNLSLTLSSTMNSSAINLVGANVNGRDSIFGRDSILGRDISGYCQMAPILNKTNQQHQLVRTSTKNFDGQSPKTNETVMDCSTIYCAMAPIMPKDAPVQSPPPTLPNQEYVEQNPMKNITFERTFDFDEERPSTLDCSMKFVEHSNHASLSDITSSSGVSSFDGSNIVATSMRCVTPADVTTPTTTKPTRTPAKADDCRDSDDAISLTYTESPPQSAQSNRYFHENPFIYHRRSNYDEKTSSYFPNSITSNDQLNTSIDTVLKTAKRLHMASAADTPTNGLIRSWARFRKIDFSPLKIKINSIWQRSNQEY